MVPTIIFPLATITYKELTVFTPLTRFLSDRRFDRKPVQQSVLKQFFADHIKNFRNPAPDLFTSAAQQVRRFILGIVLEHDFSQHFAIELIQVLQALLYIVDKNNSVFECAGGV